MESKFIEGTDEQYSIREDGVVIRHYTKRPGIYSNIKVYEDMQIEPNEKNKAVYLFLSNPRRTKAISPQSTLFLYFGFRYCIHCNNKFTPKTKRHRICPECEKQALKNARDSQYRCELRNKEVYAKRRAKTNKIRNSKEEYKEMNRNRGKKLVQELSKSYIAGLLNIPTSELTDELYSLKKSILIFKRRVSKENNINIESLI